jgi:hypothetical protein
MAQAQYIELLCSLPHLVNPFVHRRTPISNVQFTKRLNMMDFDDRKRMLDLAEAFYWGRIELGNSDQAIIEKANRQLQQITDADLEEWLLWRMDFRTVLAALRRRKHAKEAPAPGTPWGFGRYIKQIENNWAHPHFKLQSRFPWLPTAASLLETEDSFELEKLLLSTAWDYYSRQQADQPYSFSAVWLYAMKWDLVDRWCSYNTEQAQQTFDLLVMNGLQQPLAQLRTMA